jgi:hypothetical protein
MLCNQVKFPIVCPWLCRKNILIPLDIRPNLLQQTLPAADHSHSRDRARQRGPPVQTAKDGNKQIAGQIKKMQNTIALKVVNGRKVVNKYVGGLKAKASELLKDVQKDQQKKKTKQSGEQASLHLMALDELGSICQKRWIVTSVDTAMKQLL